MTDSPSLAMQVAPADMVDPARLDDIGRQQAAIIAASVSAGGSSSIATFGAGPQRKLSGFLDQLLAGARADDIGVAGALVAELAADIEALGLPAVRREAEGRQSPLAGLPIIGKYYSAFRRFRAVHVKITDHLVEVERRADTHLGKLKASNAGLDRLLDATDANLREVEVWIVGGQQALLRLRAAFEVERAVLAVERDPVRLGRLRDTAEQSDAFEARLVRMHAAFTCGILAMPQIRIAQQAGQIEIQNTLETILLDLPGLRAAIIRVAALHQVSRASAAAEPAQGGMAGDVEMLTRVTDKMLATIDRGLQIDRENRSKREAAVLQLGEVRNRLLEGLRTHASQAMKS